MAADAHLAVMAKPVHDRALILQWRHGDPLGVGAHRIIHGLAQDERRDGIVWIGGGDVNDP